MSRIECVKTELLWQCKGFPTWFHFSKFMCELILIIGIIKSIPNRMLIINLDKILFCGMCSFWAE